MTETIGGTARFICEVNFGKSIVQLNWKFNEKIVYSYYEGVVTYPKGSDKYFVVQEQDTFILEVRNLNFDDGGICSCQVMDDHAEAALVVLCKYFCNISCISLYLMEMA